MSRLVRCLHFRGDFAYLAVTLDSVLIKELSLLQGVLIETSSFVDCITSHQTVVLNVTD